MLESELLGMKIVRPFVFLTTGLPHSQLKHSQLKTSSLGTSNVYLVLHHSRLTAELQGSRPLHMLFVLPGFFFFLIN